MEKNQDLPYDIEHSEADAIIEKMARNEELVSELYDAYGKNFHELSSFWNELSAEEKIHAGWLRALGKKMKEKKGLFSSQTLQYGSDRKSSSPFETTYRKIQRFFGAGNDYCSF